RRAPALRAHRRNGLPAVRIVLLLVAEVHRPDDERGARRRVVSVLLRRLQPDVLSDAPARPARHAAPRLHLPARRRLDDDERAGAGGRRLHDARRHPLHRRCVVVAAGRRGGERRSVAGRHARVGDLVAAPRVQLPASADGRRTRAAVGQPAGSADRRRPAQRRARCARHARDGCGARSPRRIPGTDEMAAADGAVDVRVVRRIDLHRVGGRLLRGAAVRVDDRMVLAEASGRDRHAGVADRAPDAADAERTAERESGMTSRQSAVGSRQSAVVSRQSQSSVRTLDVSMLAPGGFGHRSLMWWGTLGLVLIEGTMFALAIGAYFYLRSRNTYWPPQNIAPPDLTWGTLNLLVLLASAVPNELAKKAAEHVDLRAVRVWLVVCLVFGLAFNLVRVFEFLHLNVTFSNDAYGSIVWLLLGLHTVHIATDVADT